MEGVTIKTAASTACFKLTPVAISIAATHLCAMHLWISTRLYTGFLVLAAYGRCTSALTRCSAVPRLIWATRSKRRAVLLLRAALQTCTLAVGALEVQLGLVENHALPAYAGATGDNILATDRV